MSEQGSRPKVSVIIPSWTGEVSRVMESIREQTFQDYEVDVVTGVSPAARARNVGVARSDGEILLFIDDDAFFGSKHVLQNLINALECDPQMGVVGTSKLVPRTATPLQKAIARQVPRMVYPIVTSDIHSNPPLTAYGFTAVSTTCCVVRRSVFEAVGGFDETLTTGPEDTDFFYRVHRKGFNISVAANSWVYHDPPSNVRDLLRKSFWYGLGHALEARKSPERRMDVLPLDRWYGILALPLALLAFPFSFFLHYYFDPVRKVEIGFRPLKTLSTYAVLCGYVYGWYRGQPSNPATTYMGRKAAGDNSDAATGNKSNKVPKPAKVLYVDAYPKFGGGQRVLYFMVTMLDHTRYDSLVAIPRHNPLRERLAEVGVRCVPLDFQESNYTMPSFMRPLTLPLSAASIVRIIWQIARLARREKIDLIHANSAVVGVHALPAAMLLGLPCVVHAHDFNTADLTNRLLTLLMKYPKSAMIFVSQALADHYQAKRQKYPYRVIHNAVDIDAFHPDPLAREHFLEELGLPLDSYLIGAIGRIEPWKGFDLTVQAFARVAAEHPNARLAVVGDVIFDHMRSVKDDLVKMVADLGIADKVVFTGFRSDIPFVMSAIDLLVHCPVDREGFPMIMLEAMACARPIVTVPSGGTVEQVIDGINGLLAPIGDVERIAEATSRIVANPALGREMGEAGRRMVEENLTVDKHAARVERFYDAILGKEATQRRSGIAGSQGLRHKQEAHAARNP
ncbi:MAG TPA: glycosyltransferase [Chloroflexia bacterium]|nr:glycosyltransferase [Chloroflexia bacterium]